MAAIIIFLISYLFISGKPPRFLPIDRPTGALLGAFLMIACGVVPFTTALSPTVIDWNTILPLLGAMIQSSLLDQAGFYRYLVAKVAGRTPTPRRLLAYTMLVSGGLSALLVNDTVCVLLTPLIVSLAGCLTIIGSVANIIVIENMGDDVPKIGFFKFLRYGVPITAVSTLLGVGILLAEGSLTHWFG